MPSPSSLTRRKSTPSSLKFTRNDQPPGGGTKPLPTPSSIQHVLLLMVVHLCRKYLFIEEHVKICVYLGSIFVGSIISDFAPFPRTYFSRKDNIFNTYFVKLSWAWTLLFVVSFIYMTARVYTCRNWDMIKRHLLRIVVATGIWYVCTMFFVKVENNYGMCSKPLKINDKYHCTSSGHKWYAFSISGHSFILIYCAMLIKEEAKALIGWDGIKDMIRNEEYSRSTDGKEETQLYKLSDEELSNLKDDYSYFTPYIRGVFIGMSLLSILWDIMLISTIMYFHSMIEKFLGGVISILMWFVTYRFWYRRKGISPGLPGEGNVRIQDSCRSIWNLSQGAETLKSNSLLTLSLAIK
nr:EOG090X07YX [Artemia franciscana]